MTTKHQDQTVIRDTGPYSGRNLAKGASITDAAQVFAALRCGLTVEEVRDGARSGKLLSQRGRSSRDRIWAALHHRYLTHRIPWVISAIADALGDGEQSPEFNIATSNHMHILAFDPTGTCIPRAMQWVAGGTAEQDNERK